LTAESETWRKMRVLMIAGVAGKAEAGVAGIVYNVTKELRKLGHTVKPVFFDDLLPKTRWPRRFRTFEFAAAIAEYVSGVKNDFDVINVHAPFGFLYGFQRRRGGLHAGPPYIMTMHGLEERRNYAMGREAKKGRADYFRWQNRLWQHFYHMRTYQWSFQTADQCIVTNREALLFLQLHYKLPPDRVWFIPNGVGPEFFHQRSSIENSTPRLLFVGTWIDHKGIYPLAEAFAQLSALIPGVRLTIAGCTETEEGVRRYFSHLTQSSLEVRPFVSRGDMPALYASHDIFVLPSLVEGMPLVLLEAMASGLAVVTTESSGMTDVVEDGHDGLLTIPGDATSLVLAITKVCEAPQLRHQLGNAAQEKMKRFSWTRFATRHEAVFNRAAGLNATVLSDEVLRINAKLEDKTQQADVNVGI
jgi:glycosyltransferase involved in cell wall biosynthesis